MIKQAFEPIPIPKEAYPRGDRKVMFGETTTKTLSAEQIFDSAKLGMGAAIAEGGGDLPIDGSGGADATSGRKWKRSMGRRGGSFGRPAVSPKKRVIEEFESVDILEIFRFLEQRGETFGEGPLLRNEAKSTFLMHLLRSSFPALPDGKFSIRRKEISDEAKKLGRAVPVNSVKKMKFLIERCEGELKELAEEDETARESIMTKKIKYMDELERLDKPMSLHEACRVGEVDVVAEILSPEGRPELVDMTDESGHTPLITAIKHQHLHLVRYMLAACRANPNELSVGGNAPLHEAAIAGQKEMVALLCNYGSEPTATNCYGETPLHFAARQGNEEVVDCLVSYGAHVDVLTTKGKYTPLMFAAGAGKVDSARRLMDLGADPAIRNLHWQTAMMRAAAAGHDDCVSAIVNWQPGDDGQGHKKKKNQGKKGAGKGGAMDAKRGGRKAAAKKK